MGVGGNENMINNVSMYIVKYAKYINSEIFEAERQLGDRKLAETIVYTEFGEAVQEYLSGEVQATESEFVGFFKKYVRFALTDALAEKSRNALRIIKSPNDMSTSINNVTKDNVSKEESLIEEVDTSPWYKDFV